jgi:hypothetical protein
MKRTVLKNRGRVKTGSAQKQGALLETITEHSCKIPGVLLALRESLRKITSNFQLSVLSLKGLPEIMLCAVV